MKKLLALVLALVMTLSLCVVSSNAAYTDAADVELDEAVDVLTAVGVFQGSDGKFDPKANLTREQAAKLVAYLQIGQKAADALVGGGKFTDVAKDRWSAGYVDYCASIGIAAGVGDGKFDPAGSLTALQFGKMLLVCLGYDAKVEGLTGSQWSINVAKLALKADLTDGMDEISLSAPMTREQAAQMAFNTEQATMVEYDNQSTITAGNVTIKTQSKAEPQDQGNYFNMYGEAVETLQFSEKYCKDLDLDSDNNALGQPVNKWTYKSDSIGKYAKDADKVLVVKDKNKTLTDILTSASYADYDTAELPTNNNKVSFNGDHEEDIDAAKAVVLSKGDVVYVYENTAGKVDYVAVARYMLAKIDKVETNMTSAEKDNGAAYRVKLEALGEHNLGTYYDTYDVKTTLQFANFDAAKYVADATLAVAFDNDHQIVDSYVVEGVTGKVTAADNETNGYVTIGGTKYNYAGEIPEHNGVVNIDFDEEYTVYATKEGYAIGLDGAESMNLDDVYYVTGFYAETKAGEVHYYAERVSLDGKVDTVEIEKGALQKLSTPAPVGDTYSQAIDGAFISANFNTGRADLYTFSDKLEPSVTGDHADTWDIARQKANNEVYTIKTAMPTGYTATSKLEDDANTLTAAIKTTSTKLTIDHEGTFYTNADTKFLSVESHGSNIDVGANVGGMKAALGTSALVIVDTHYASTAVAVIFYGDSLTTSTATKDVVYLKGASSDKTAADRYTATLWEMKDGTSKEVTITDDTNYNGFFTYTLKDDGAYKLSTSDTKDLTELGVVDGFYNGTTKYDDEEGYLRNAVISNAYDKQNVSYISVWGENGRFVNVDAKGATVIDNRSATKKDGQVYKYTIRSVDDIVDTLEVGCVFADIYFNDGVTFIAVDEVLDYQTMSPVDTDTREEYEALEDGVYVPRDTNFVKLGDAATGTAEQNRVFKYTGIAKEQFELVVKNADGETVYTESWDENDEVGEDYIVYITLVGSLGSNAGEGTYKNANFAAGAYTFEIKSQTSSKVALSGCFRVFSDI